MDKEQLMKSIKSSVGYNGCASNTAKSSFMIGASVAADWTNEHWEKKYKNLTTISENKDREITRLTQKLDALKSALKDIIS